MSEARQVASPRSDRTEARKPHPTPREVVLTASDGYELAATLHPGSSRDGTTTGRPAVLLASGSGIPRGFYRRFAGHLAGEGISVLTFDYRGIGGSRPKKLRGFEATMSDWGRLDLAAAVRWLDSSSDAGEIHLVGHSAGGQIAGLAPNAEELDSIVGVAAQSGYWGHWSSWRKWLFADLWYALVPGLARITGYLPTGKTGLWPEDLPKGVALEWARWCRQPRYLLDSASERVRRRYEGIDAPLLAFSFAGDTYAPPDAVDAWTNFFPSAPTTRRHVPGHGSGGSLGHFGFFQKAAEGLWEEVAYWVHHGAQVAGDTQGPEGG